MRGRIGFSAMAAMLLAASALPAAATAPAPARRVHTIDEYTPWRSRRKADPLAAERDVHNAVVDAKNSAKRERRARQKAARKAQRGFFETLFALFALFVAAIAVLACVGVTNWEASNQCNAQWARSSLRTSWSYFSGCAVQRRDGTWIPSTAIRDLPVSGEPAAEGTPR